MGEVDPDALSELSLRVWNYKMGEMVAVGIHLGDRLGLYKALAGAGPLSAADVAARAGLDERFTLEWLLGQAAADLIVRTADGCFELSDEGALILAHEGESRFFAGGTFRGGFERHLLDQLEESFRTGRGLSYEDLGSEAAASLARTTSPSALHVLEAVVLPAFDGTIDRLSAGATVVDIGCGAGVALTRLAESFPNSTCIGVDPSGSAIALGRDGVSERGLQNITFIEGTADDVPADTAADLVCTFDCLHDMARPDLTAQTIRSFIADDGTWLIKDIRCSGDFETDRRNPMLALMYAFSITSCLQSARSEPDGLGLGTMGLHPGKVDEIVSAAGFELTATHSFDEDPTNFYYDVRPVMA